VIRCQIWGRNAKDRGKKTPVANLPKVLDPCQLVWQVKQFDG
jgi:hypothetical protein